MNGLQRDPYGPLASQARSALTELVVRIAPRPVVEVGSNTATQIERSASAPFGLLSSPLVVNLGVTVCVQYRATLSHCHAPRNGSGFESLELRWVA